MIRGFSNPDIRNKLKDSPHLKDIADPRRQSAKVTRIFNRCHAHALIAKIPHSRRWRLTKQGRIAMSASMQMWHERYGMLTQSVNVKADATTTVDFMYTGNEKPAELGPRTSPFLPPQRSNLPPGNTRYCFRNSPG